MACQAIQPASPGNRKVPPCRRSSLSTSSPRCLSSWPLAPLPVAATPLTQVENEFLGELHAISQCPQALVLLQNFNTPDCLLLLCMTVGDANTCQGLLCNHLPSDQVGSEHVMSHALLVSMQLLPLEPVAIPL